MRVRQSHPQADSVALASGRPAGSLVRRGRRQADYGSTPAGEPPLFHPEWWKISPVLLFTSALFALLTQSLPPFGILCLITAAVAVPAFTPIFVRMESRVGEGAAQRYALLTVVVAVPMFCFGIAFALWARGLPIMAWTGVLGLLASTGTIASVMLSYRPWSILVAQVSLWTGLTLVAGTPIAYAVLLLGGVASVFLARRQIESSRQEAQKRAETAHVQARAAELLREYEQSGQGWFWETDRRGAITYISSKIAVLLGRKPEEMTGQSITDIFDLSQQADQSERTLTFHLSTRSSFQELAVRAAVSGDEERWWSISGRPVHDHLNNYVGFRGSGTDLTEKKRSQENASRLAHYDSLTNLANRLQMSQMLEKILNAQRADQRFCAIFLIDLDRFKQVNDTMGHPAGDALLTQVAQRLERTVDAAGRVGRLGGDEFKVILPGRIERHELAGLAELIIENLSQPYSIEGHSVVIGASVGIAMSPDDGVTSEALIRNADLALYAAKDGGRGRHHFYAPDLHSDAEERRRLEHELRDAIASGGLELYYQPVVQTTTEKITGFEALLRWHHPRHGPLSPATFIPVAEDTGLIAQIGEWALRTACFDLARWPEHIRVAVNVSPLQFANPSLPAIITNALASAQVCPSRLELEITESVFLNDDNSTDAMFTALKRIGVRLALDDFGTGYSSLGYLKKAPFDKIKIDQSFVRGATIEGSRNGALISSIVSLAESLGMETTAEGVETLDELDLIRMLGCSHVQGYIYDKPLTAEAASERLQSGLIAIAHGPRSARPPRHTMLRKVVLDHGGEKYHGTIRNISPNGAMIEGLWNVPPGTTFIVLLSDGDEVTATSRWSKEDRMGVEFATPLQVDSAGHIALAVQRQEHHPGILRKMG